MARNVFGAGSARRILAILVLAAITALALDSRDASLVTGTRARSADALHPITGVVGSLLSPVGDAWNGVFHYRSLQRDNEKLRAQVADLQGREALARAKLAQYHDYYDLLNLPWAPSIAGVAANIVGARPSNFDQSVQIDRGSADGIKAGYPVVTGAGLVGRVVAVSAHVSSVRLLTDAAFTAGVFVGEDPTGLLRGEGVDNKPSVELVQKPRPTAADQPQIAIAVGTAVTTSGIDVSLFPKDIPVGVVASVASPVGSGNLVITVRPAADLNHLHVVKVLQWDPPKERP
jgi:rod shape-determining protein MreC